MASLNEAIAIIQQSARHPAGHFQQAFKAFVGLGVMIVLPTVLVYWARKRFRP